MRLNQHRITSVLFVLALGGCGGRAIVPTKPVDMTIPPEIAKAFEVRDPSASAAEAPPAPGPDSPSPSTTQKGRSKKGKPIATTAKVAAKAPAQGMLGPAAGFTIPRRRPAKDPIWVGEKIWMDVTWLNTKAGEFEIEVLPFKVMNGRKVYDFKGTARTSELFSLVYKAEDWVESFVDYEGWFPYKFILHGDETKHIRNHLELYDHAARKQYIAIHDNRIQKGEIHEKKGYEDLTPFSQDSLSAIFYVRTLDFEVGKVLKFPMTTSGSQWETEVSVLAREEVKTKLGYIKAFKCKVETRFKGVLQTQGDAFMWFSDDDRKFLVKFEAKVRIGWVSGVTKRIEPGTAPEASAPAATPSPSGKTTSHQQPDSIVVPASVTAIRPEDTQGLSMVERPASHDDQRGGMIEDKRKYKRVWFRHLLESLSS